MPTQHTRSLGLAVLRGPTIVLLSPVDGSEGELHHRLRSIDALCFFTLADRAVVLPL